MPTYDYECRSCGHRFETFQSMSDDPLSDCPECSGSQLRRLIGGGSGIIFRGSGFYVNDSRKGGSSASDSPKSAKSSGSGAKAAAAADSSGGKASA